MAQPTRLIEQDIFDELIAAQGGTIPVFKNVAIQFDPEGKLPADPGIRVMMLNVHEPVLYRDSEKRVFVVLPIFEPPTFEILRDCHTIKDAWMYRFSDIHFDKDWPLDKAQYFTKDFPKGTFELGNVATH